MAPSETPATQLPGGARSRLAVASMAIGLALIAVPILVSDPFGPLRPYSAEDYYRRGLNYLEKSLPALAAKDLELALERDPYRPGPYVALARLELEQGRAQSALARLRKAVWLDPRDAGSVALRARVYEALGEAELARADDELAEALSREAAAAPDSDTGSISVGAR